MASERPDRAVVPIDRERPFAAGELFFSTTDLKGHIRSGNDVFVRVSGHERERLIGAAHNIIRHPDMPRGVFKVFWDMLDEGTGVAAYVKNMAADGSYYWVLALVVPIEDGFLSVRTKPRSALFDAARSIYERVLEHEQEIEAGDLSRRKLAIDAGVDRTLELLAEAGFPDYRAFMRAALVAELTETSAVVGRAAIEVDDDASVAVRTLADARDQLDVLVADLQRFAGLAEDLTTRSRFLLSLAGNIRLLALNAVVTSARLGERAAALGAVAQVLGNQSRDAEPEIRSLNEMLERSVGALGVMQFRIASSKLLTQMVFDYIQGDEHGSVQETEALADLACALADGAGRLAEAMASFYGSLESIEGGARQVERMLGIVQALEINGRVEGARLGDAQISALFSEVGKEVATASDQLHDFSGLRRLVGTESHDAGRRLCAVLERTAADLDELAGESRAA